MFPKGMPNPFHFYLSQQLTSKQTCVYFTSCNLRTVISKTALTVAESCYHSYQATYTYSKSCTLLFASAGGSKSV